jgi:transcriptional regulator with XRE-family HTH domain
MSEAIAADAVDFGTLLKDWRQHRRVSQLGLSGISGISQRHISFLETGRSRPSRGMVLALSDSLDIPLRERNALLQSAGFAATYSERPLTSEKTVIFEDALKATLAHHEPYPALVLDGRWNLVMANEGALAFFGLFVDVFQALKDIGNPAQFQIARLCLADRGLKPFIVNWEEIAWSFLSRARRALLVNPRDLHLPKLIEEITGHPEAPREWQQPDWTTPPDPALAMTMRKGDQTFTLFTMLAHFGAAQSVTLEELSVEIFYPADEPTRSALIALAGTAA